ncbi:hypothetical protein HDU80_008120 [Chytriomyces hyalinus]|nr:hypothetical protein HDU80_008120 [Chytriomyces hyalinus]
MVPQRALSIFPKKTEFILILVTILFVLWTIGSRWSLKELDIMPRNLEHRRGPQSAHLPSDAPVRPPQLTFQDLSEFKSVVGNALQKALEEQQWVIHHRQFLPSGTRDENGAQPSLESLEADIDVLQAQFLDYLNGEEGVEEVAVFGGSLLNLQSSFDILKTWKRVHQYAMLVKSAEYNRTEFLHLGRRARSNLIAYTVLYDKPSLLPSLSLPSKNVKKLRRELASIVDESTALLYPWLKPTYSSIKEMQTRFVNKDSESQEGLVICTGKWHFEMAVHLIETLRKVLQCTLPIEVHYGGPDDLPPDMLKAFNAMPNVKTVSILDFFPLETKLWGGWSMKPFALLGSRFRKVIIVDADALFLQDPRVIFNQSEIFKQHGQMFYHDRTLGGNDPWWFKSINPQWSKFSASLRYMGKGIARSSQHEMESGVVAVDKGRTGVLHSLLLVCKMNSKLERDGITYRRVHGDKETFWISWDLIRVPYKFTPTFGGTVGYMNERSHVCGGLFHTDEQSNPFWWNGGVMANKHISKDAEFMKFDYVAFDTTENSQREVRELTAREKSDGARYVDIYKEIKAKGWQAYFKESYRVDFFV